MDAIDFTHLMKLAYEWLNHFNADCYPQPETRQLLTKIQDAIDDNRKHGISNFKREMALIKRLIKTSLTFTDRMEQAYTLLECGLTAYGIGRMEEARKILGEAVIKFFPNQYESTIAKWMMGCILWQLDGKQDDAAVLWRRCIESITAQEANCSSPEKREWYETCRSEMTRQYEQVFQSISVETNPSKNESEEPEIIQPHDDQASSTGETGQNIIMPLFALWEDLLQLYPVVEKVSAGIPRYFGDQSVPLDYVQVSQVVINEIPHMIVSIRKDDNLINTARDEVAVLRVNGVSMDQYKLGRFTGINNNDCVLVRRCDLSNVKNGDIVVAEIQDEDVSQALLKEYLYEGNTHILKPHSSDENIKERRFEAGDTSFSIWGVVMAVFKPIEG
jgi:SOS-response transcriptional repressor LexA